MAIVFLLAGLIVFAAIGVPLAFITSLYLHWPVYLAVLAVKAEGVVKGIILSRRYISRKWIRNVIEGVQ